MGVPSFLLETSLVSVAKGKELYTDFSSLGECEEQNDLHFNMKGDVPASMSVIEVFYIFN